MKIAVAQIACALGDVAANVAKMRALTQQAKEQRAELIVFPEMSDTGYAMSAIRKCASDWEEGAAAQLRAIARDFSIALLSGVSERDGDSIYNAQVVIDAGGTIIAKYRKAHLFAVAPIEENKCFAAGEELTSIKFNEFQFGLSICYDLRFPELFRALAVEGEANVLVNSSAWPFPRIEHLRALAMARAIENQSYLILANRVGSDDGVTFCGSSVLIDPYGAIIAAASADREELIIGEISKPLIESVRERMPVFSHRRPHLYR